MASLLLTSSNQNSSKLEIITAAAIVIIIEQLIKKHSAIKLLIAEYLIKIELLIAEDVVKHLIKKSSVAEYSVIVEQNSQSKIAGTKQLDGIAAAAAAVGQSIKEQSVKAEFLVAVEFSVAAKRLVVVGLGAERLVARY